MNFFHSKFFLDGDKKNVPFYSLSFLIRNKFYSIGIGWNKKESWNLSYRLLYKNNADMAVSWKKEKIDKDKESIKFYFYRMVFSITYPVKSV